MSKPPRKQRHYRPGGARGEPEDAVASRAPAQAEVVAQARGKEANGRRCDERQQGRGGLRQAKWVERDVGDVVGCGGGLQRALHGSSVAAVLDATLVLHLGPGRGVGTTRAWGPPVGTKHRPSPPARGGGQADAAVSGKS